MRHTELQGDWVQTCALPILELKHGGMADLATLATKLAEALPISFEVRSKAERGYALDSGTFGESGRGGDIHFDSTGKIGRASSRERVEISVVGGSLKKRVDT